MSRAGFGALVAVVVAIAFGATWFVSAQPGGHAPGPAAEAPLPAPLAPASAGQMQCYQPDASRLTCRALVTYAKGANGEIEDTELDLVSASPVVVMRTVFPVTIKAGQVCDAMPRRVFESADFTVDGAPASADQSARLRRTMLKALQRYLGHEECIAYISEDRSSVATATIDGVPMPPVNQKVIWVSQGDGYSVDP